MFCLMISKKVDTPKAASIIIKLNPRDGIGSAVPLCVCLPIATLHL